MNRLTLKLSDRVFLLVAAFTFAGMGCGTYTSPADELAQTDTRCGATSAVISVNDGSFTNICGCQESRNQVISQGTPLECTIPAGSTVFFTYLSSANKAQIISLGQPAFVSSMPYDPADKARTRSFSITFANPGTYHFEDAFNGTMTGDIVVQ